MSQSAITGEVWIAVAPLFALGVLLVAQMVILSKLRAAQSHLKYLRNISSMLFDLDTLLFRLNSDFNQVQRALLESHTKPLTTYDDRFDELATLNKQFADATRSLIISNHSHQTNIEAQIRDLRSQLEAQTGSDDTSTLGKMTWKEFKELVRASNESIAGAERPSTSPKTPEEANNGV